MEKEVKQCPGAQPEDMDKWRGLKQEQVWERKITFLIGICSVWDSTSKWKCLVWNWIYEPAEVVGTRVTNLGITGILMAFQASSRWNHPRSIEVKEKRSEDRALGYPISRVSTKNQKSRQQKRLKRSVQCGRRETKTRKCFTSRKYEVKRVKCFERSYKNKEMTMARPVSCVAEKAVFFNIYFNVSETLFQNQEHSYSKKPPDNPN